MPTMTDFTPKMTSAELEAFFDREFPERLRLPLNFEEVADGSCRLRLVFREDQLRPGRTIAGPVLMTLADTAAYVLVLTHFGPETVGVTASLHIDFLRRPEARDTLAHAELLHLGRTQLVARVTMRSDGDPRPVAHATATFAILQPRPEAAR